MGTGRYIYGLIRSTEDKDFGYIGLEHEGKPGRVYTVRIDSIAAVVSEYASRDKMLPLRKNLDPHHRVLREVMKVATMVPMTFGHLAKGDDEIARILRRNRDSINGEFDRVDGKVEMTLKVKWDVDNIFDYFVGLDPELAAFRDELFGRSHAPAPAEKIELGKMFEQRLNQERQEQTERVVEAFRPRCCEIKENPPKNETTVMDLAFLIKRDAIKAFEEGVYQVAGTFPTQYIFDFSGPWAPFNFVKIDLRKAAV
ncbi:MAG: GvpL/GvpF family gas vesicle protein [Deltaproteobacteria bacterium]|nr:GvpL/GvpF family gas vesicle protein [Deltaproteobacteria bacterium]